MIAYLDTSALVPLLVEEEASTACETLWDLADDIVTCQLTYVETAAALAAAQRMRRITTTEHAEALAVADRLWQEVDVVTLDDVLVAESAEIAASQALRGYDAVQCASALRVAVPDMVAASGDRHLLDAWSRLGVTTLNVHQ